MAKTNNSPIEMRLLSVNEVSFSMKAGIIGEEDRGDVLQLGFKHELHPNLTDNLFSLDFGVQYSIDGQTLLESIYRYDFEVKELSKYVDISNDGKITVRDILPHLESVAVGTMRGILVVRTAGTDLARYPIPMIDPIELCNNLAK